jgi:hypothetical protein
MFPIAINPPPATEQFRNIATGISGGLITSTLMTLIVIPVAYSLMDDALELLKRVYMGPPSAVLPEPAPTEEDVTLAGDVEEPAEELSALAAVRERAPVAEESAKRRYGS